MELSQLAFTIQTVAVPPIALLMFVLARAIPGRFLDYWSLGWLALAIALIGLRFAISMPPASPASRSGLMIYCCFEYTSAFLFWAGCRDLASNKPLRQRDLALLVPALLFGIIAPWQVPSVYYLRPYHAPLFGAYFLLALFSTRKYRQDGQWRSFGIHVLRLCLLILGLLFIHYGPVSYWSVYILEDPWRLRYMVLSPMFDALVEMGLAFGMAVLAMERVRDGLAAANLELEEANRQLAEARDELAVAARTDALTGLLNRRGFEALVAQPAGAPLRGAVAALDLNGLKQINDTYGHHAGDAAIQHCARALRNQFRVTDALFRMGGDEFLVLLAGGRGPDLERRLEGVDSALKLVRLPGVTEAMGLTLAWGVAEFSQPTEIEDAVRRADAAMYECKARRKAAMAANNGSPANSTRPAIEQK